MIFQLLSLIQLSFPRLACEPVTHDFVGPGLGSPSLRRADGQEIPGTNRITIGPRQLTSAGSLGNADFSSWLGGA
ncbi:hypothetical protein BGZ61DRAFT_453706 [Ilyonectria robusta]|uniref:uncharacterized protein n=1 Tax=Ilyonectria robusta TaxID=1079257 RepID=UPI001E8E5576|nr:uncharacterized protein BGZ61DRAFT_453706 [Ilyonectria robusta]KAH8686828.1 hypothetical protein BGZ61DRAFT_453706 [Ilyonectria robusta]